MVFATGKIEIEFKEVYKKYGLKFKELDCADQ